MKVTRLGWMGVKTRQFDGMNTFYRDVLNLEVLSIDDESGRFKLDDGTEVHVYAPRDQEHPSSSTRSHGAPWAGSGSTSSRRMGTCTKSSAATTRPSFAPWTGAGTPVG